MGMALAEPLALNRAVDGNIIFFIEIIRSEFLLLLNYTIQLLFVWEIRSVNNEGHNGNACPTVSFLLQVICVCIFQVAVFKEMRDSVNIFALLWHAERPPDPTYA